MSAVARLAALAAVVALAGCAAAAPSPAPSSPVQQVQPDQVYISISVSQACADGSISVNVSHVAPVDVLLVRAAIVAAFRSRAERRLAAQAACKDGAR